MDSAHSAHMTGVPSASSPSSPPPLVSAYSFPQDVAYTDDQLTSKLDVFTSDTSPSRQQRLLQGRNARFPAKKLSISNLSNKLTQLIGKNDSTEKIEPPSRNQENKLYKSRSTGTIAKSSTLSVLEEVSGTTRNRSIRRRPGIPIYQDNPERPLLESSPFAGSSPQFDIRAEITSPTTFDHIHDSLNGMRLREVSINEGWSPWTKSPPSYRSKARKRSVQTQLDTNDYIDHIEKELQQVRDEAYSPLTRRPMKEKLRAATKENERLQEELALLKEKFETEVKRAVEHKTITEVELRRRVRDLEDSLEGKDRAIRELQYQYEEKRLDSNIIDTLKTTIERLEQDKVDMEQINLSMSKRNEVLTQLLAMSPTKTTSGFNLGSPTREKRNGRPISLILPRRPTSPTMRQLRMASSAAGSPQPQESSNISPLKLSPSSEYTGGSKENSQKLGDLLQHTDEHSNGSLRSPKLEGGLTRRWTIYSDISSSSANTCEEPRVVARRKARKFMAGSTQLKPLLLPTLTGETMSVQSASTASSPRSWLANSNYESDVEDTILANDAARVGRVEPSAVDDVHSLQVESWIAPEGPGPALEKVYLEAGGQDDHLQQFACPQDALSAGSGLNIHMSEQYERRLSKFVVESIEEDDDYFGLHRAKRSNHVSGQSLQAMPMPSTPDSLAALPRPLFSPVHQRIAVTTNRVQSGLESRSPSIDPEQQINLRKRRRPSTSACHTGSPVAKARRHRRRHSAVPNKPHMFEDLGPQPTQQVDTPDSVAARQLRNIRSSDNFVEMLRQKNFAAKPLAAMTIRTMYKMLATCTSVVRDVKRDPFALARRVLANAWRMNWEVLGKVSWWVLGLFVQPQSPKKARAPIDWDQYDGESIADRYCSSLYDSQDDQEISHMIDDKSHQDHKNQVRSQQKAIDETKDPSNSQEKKPGWGRSLFLWGKFSAAMMLAVGGAVVNGPGEMLKEIPLQRHQSKHRMNKYFSADIDMQAKVDQRAENKNRRKSFYRHSTGCFCSHDTRHSLRDSFGPEHNLRTETQLDSSSFLDQIQEGDHDPTLRPEQHRRRRVESYFAGAASPFSATPSQHCESLPTTLRPPSSRGVFS